MIFGCHVQVGGAVAEMTLRQGGAMLNQVAVVVLLVDAARLAELPQQMLTRRELALAGK